MSLLTPCSHNALNNPPCLCPTDFACHLRVSPYCVGDFNKSADLETGVIATDKMNRNLRQPPCAIGFHITLRVLDCPVSTHGGSFRFRENWRANGKLV